MVGALIVALGMPGNAGSRYPALRRAGLSETAYAASVKSSGLLSISEVVFASAYAWTVPFPKILARRPFFLLLDYILYYQMLL